MTQEHAVVVAGSAAGLRAAFKAVECHLTQGRRVLCRADSSGGRRHGDRGEPSTITNAFSLTSMRAALHRFPEDRAAALDARHAVRTDGVLGRDLPSER
ncbi:hypothetical protein R1CP_36400 (plasmid) [Rhodococcus opacus]|uniref:Uncharacterized protein n=1 Tax=Rhodococcus opacus TaxID=37919 RepID=A0A1B1KH03_RHOOP|nr:hypothetical protein R1CP_36400 [Rhodococcus opacus]